MPFLIRKLKNQNLYKVYSNGKSHSSYGMTRPVAEKQLLALRITEYNRKKVL